MLKWSVPWRIYFPTLQSDVSFTKNKSTNGLKRYAFMIKWSYKEYVFMEKWSPSKGKVLWLPSYYPYPSLYRNPPPPHMSWSHVYYNFTCIIHEYEVLKTLIFICLLIYKVCELQCTICKILRTFINV